jgi:hypothetical protein
VSCDCTSTNKTARKKMWDKKSRSSNEIMLNHIFQQYFDDVLSDAWFSHD